MIVGAWPSPSHGLGKVALIDATYYQRLVAAVLIQAKADARSRDPALRAEARAWLATDAHDWLALICPSDRDVRQVYAAYVALVDEAA